MIPTWNCAGYLRRTLRSVLQQAPARLDMQIEVVDDCSDRDDPESVVRQLEDDRVSFFRNPRRLGPPANFTNCIRRSRGLWVHILHGDDMVLDGFYAHLREAVERHPSLGAAFSRFAYVDENDHWLRLSPRRRETPGVVTAGFIDRLMIVNRILPSAVVVRREVYEALGGFHPDLFHSADWDMWKRIALQHPIWYEPQPLVLYRLHSQSDTSRLRRSAANIAEVRLAIDVARAYLPPARAAELTARARRRTAVAAVKSARSLLVDGQGAAALAQLREALRCHRSVAVWALIFLMSLDAAVKLTFGTAARGPRS